MPLKNKEAIALYNKAYRIRGGDALKAKKRQYFKEYRLKVLLHYSDGILECRCCQERTYEFLSIDHKYGGGNEHRRKLGSKYIYSWLVSTGFPEGYQVLCHNCNLAKGFYKVCPHQYKKELLEK